MSIENGLEERLDRRMREVLEERNNFDLVEGKLIECWARLEGQTEDEGGEYWLCPEVLYKALKRFIGRLPAEEIMDAMRVTFQNEPRRGMVTYFCGLCWRKIELMEVKLKS